MPQDQAKAGEKPLWSSDSENCSHLAHEVLMSWDMVTFRSARKIQTTFLTSINSSMHHVKLVLQNGCRIVCHCVTAVANVISVIPERSQFCMLGIFSMNQSWSERQAAWYRKEVSFKLAIFGLVLGYTVTKRPVLRCLDILANYMAMIMTHTTYAHSHTCW